MERLHGLSRGLERIDGACSLSLRISRYSKNTAMKNIRMIDASPRGTDSASRSVADRLTDVYPTSNLLRRDLAVEELVLSDYSRLSMASQISASSSEPSKRLISWMPVGEVTLISVR